MSLPFKIKLIPIKDDDPQVIQNPLDCYFTDLSIKKLETLWSRSDDVKIQNRFIAAIVDTDDPELISQRRNSVFVNCSRLKSLDTNLREDVGVKTTNVVDVHVTWAFIEHYSFRHEGDRKNLYMLKIENLVDLESVVVGQLPGVVHSPDDLCDGTLVRSGDLFIGDKSAVVFDCSPVAEGVISSSTSITYVTISKSQFKDFLCPRRMVSTTLYNHHQVDTLKIGEQLQVALLNKIYCEADVMDSENVVIVSQTVARILKLSCTQASCFRAKMVHVDLKESDWRFVQIVTSNNVKHENIALISPQLWFNFARTIDINCSSINDVFSLVIDQESQFFPNLCEDDYSNEATIALIPSPNYAGSCDFTSLLTNYFSKPRFILKHDVIGVPSLNDPSFNNQVDDPLKMNINPTIFFKITSMDGSGFWIQKDKSALRQISFVHSFIPSLLERYHRLSFDPNFWDHNQVFHPSYSLLVDTIQPYVEKKIHQSPFILVTGPSGSGKRSLIEKVGIHWNMNVFKVDTNQILFETPAATETKIKIVAEKAAIYLPVIILLENIELLCVDQSGNDERIAQFILQSFKNDCEVCKNGPVLVIATTSNSDLIYKTSSISSMFDHVINVKDLSDSERLKVLENMTTHLPLTKSINLISFSKRMIGFNYSDVHLFINKTIGFFHTRINEKSSNSDFSASLAIPQITLEDMEQALNVMLKRISQSIGAPEVPCVKWIDVGGLEDVKKEILDTIQLPLLHPELRSNGLKRGGVLLYGPPGTGKTLLAKAVATECSLNFLSVKGPELINMYVGQSEQNVRDVFERARSVAPCVIFFDELDSLAPARGKSGDSGGVMDRVVSQLLAEMDGLNKCSELFVIGATNRPDLLDESLLRPGRFDRLIEVKVASDPSTRISILKSLTRKFNLSQNLDLDQIESKSPKNMTGADFYSLVSLSVSNCISRCIQQIELDQVKEEKVQITLEMHDFLEALSKYQGPSKVE